VEYEMTAKTNAERQATYRKNRATAGKNGDGEKRLHTFVSVGTTFALGRIAKHYGVTRREILEKMILEADSEIQKTLELDSKECNQYFNVTP
jgi:hypothetical protein